MNPSEPRPHLLAGGNPRIPKGDGDAPVQAFIAAMPEWKQQVGRRIDALITQAVPGVQKAVRWNSPFYGVENNGWFAGFHCYTRYVKLTFFAGSSLDPEPPVAGKDEHGRSVHLGEDGAPEDERLLDWFRQAAAVPGWRGF